MARYLRGWIGYFGGVRRPRCCKVLRSGPGLGSALRSGSSGSGDRCGPLNCGSGVWVRISPRRRGSVSTLGMPLQLGERIERIGVIEFAGVDQAHEQIAHLSSVHRLITASFSGAGSPFSRPFRPDYYPGERPLRAEKGSAASSGAACIGWIQEQLNTLGIKQGRGVARR